MFGLTLWYRHGKNLLVRSVMQWTLISVCQVSKLGTVFLLIINILMKLSKLLTNYLTEVERSILPGTRQFAVRSGTFQLRAVADGCFIGQVQSIVFDNKYINIMFDDELENSLELLSQDDVLTTKLPISVYTA